MDFDDIPKKLLEAKKRHHHVWAYYIRGWSIDGRHVFVPVGKDRIIRPENINQICATQHFYRTSPLTSTQISLIKSISSQSKSSILRKEHEFLLNDFIELQNRMKLLRISGLPESQVHSLEEAIWCNALEDMHGSLERNARSAFNKLRDRMNEKLTQEELFLFIEYIAHQFTRTKAFRDKSLKSNSKTNTIPSIVTDTASQCWWFLSYLFGVNLSFDLQTRRRDCILTLLVNDSETPFITSDQPVINIHPALLGENKQQLAEHELDLYYPLSPTVAYVIGQSGQFPAGVTEVNQTNVHELNIRISKTANDIIISNCAESLRPYRKYIGEKLQSI